MATHISNLSEDDGIMKFTLDNVNVSIVNAIRRIILSEIDCIIFRTTPHSENKATIHINTTRFNNEIIKQRLSCIPIHIDNIDIPYTDLLLELDEINNSDIVKVITTEDFKIKNISTDKYFSKDELQSIFPPNNISGDYIDFIRLRPKFSDDINGEQIKMECLFSIGKAKEDGSFNVVSCCAYGNTPDPRLISEKKHIYEEKLISEQMSAEDIEYNLKDWDNLEAHRYFIQNSYDFIIQSVGIYNNKVLVKKACDLMIFKINTFKEAIQKKPELLSEINSTIPNSYEIILENEDYTLGKVIEYILYDKHYNNDHTLLFCGFRKPHPHINISLIRISFKDATNMPTILTIINNCADDAINIFNHIKQLFN
jgi:DNA-directed RNA polymerase subunit L